MESKLTKEELDTIKLYQTQKYLEVNQILNEYVEDDIALLSQENEFQYSKEGVLENIDLIKKMSEILIKNFYENASQDACNTVYKGANIAEIDKLKTMSSNNTFLIAKNNQEDSKNEISNQWARAIMLQLELNEEIPSIQLNKKEKLIAPFTKVVNIQEKEDSSENENNLKMYQVSLEPQEAVHLPEDENVALYENILNRAEVVQEKLEACVELDKENTVHYENIRKLEQLLAKHHFTMEQENYEQDTTDAEKQSDLDDIARINLELSSLKDMVAKIFYIRQENTNFISEWKNDIILYLKDEWRKLKDEYINKKAERKEEVQEPIPERPADMNPNMVSVRDDVLENIAVVNTLLNNIKNLISNQQNYARIAESLDSNYKALNNAFEMKNFAEELDSLLKAILNKVDTISGDNIEEIDKISKANLQISILLNYLNNAKAAVSKKITRFDEIGIIEENELKREIAETVKNIRCEAELKKLNDDIDILEDKNRFQKFIGKFTGRNKLDDVMLDQISIRQAAIKKTFKTKMPLSYNYSIHKIIAEIQMFIDENEDDELVLEDVSKLRKIKDILKKNFVIIDSKVSSIIEQKSGKNLPLTSQKMTKKEMIEIDTYRFLNRYGYDATENVKEPEYQDTMANEIKRIVDYVKTSEIL